MGRVNDLDAGVVWLRAIFASSGEAPDVAEARFRAVPGLVGLILFRDACARAEALGPC